jgi:predicted nicotinamide N-methyase
MMARADELPDLPWWSRTYAGYRERFVEPYELTLGGGRVVLSLEQAPCVSAEHARAAKEGSDGSCTASTVWDAGIVLAAMVYEQWMLSDGARHTAEEDATDRSKRRCLDLGSGTGIVGLAAAACGGFSQVVLTDMPSVVPLLEHNVERNRSALVHDGRCGLETVSLRWDDAAELRSVAALGPYELIVGGDLLYRPQVVEPLLAALRALVGRRTTVLLAASLQHSPETIDLFVDAAATAGFAVERLGTGCQSADAQSDEVKLLRLTRRKGTKGTGSGKLRDAGDGKGFKAKKLCLEGPAGASESGGSSSSSSSMTRAQSSTYRSMQYDVDRVTA